MTRKSQREIERRVAELRDSTEPVPEVSSEVVTVTDPEDAESVPEDAMVVHDATAVTAWVRE